MLLRIQEEIDVFIQNALQSISLSLTCCPSSAVSASSAVAASRSDSALEDAQFPLAAPASAAFEADLPQSAMTAAAEVAVDSSRSVGSAHPETVENDEADCPIRKPICMTL